MRLSKLLGFIAGGIGALTGIQMMGCSEDISTKPVVKLTAEQVRSCCGTDDGTGKYEVCILDYQETGACQASQKPDNKVVSAEDIGQCCAQTEKPEACAEDFHKTCDGKANFDACVKEYKNSNKCDSVIAMYGMPVDAYVEECCKEAPDHDACAQNLTAECGGKTDVKACVDAYAKDGGCYNRPISPTVSDAEIKACCEESPDYDACAQNLHSACDNAENVDDCIAQYKQTGGCDIGGTVYGPAIDEEMVKNCCGHLEDTDAYTDCVAALIESGKCQEIVAEYGPLPDEQE